MVNSGRFTMGPHVAAFESQFAEAVGANHAIMVNSGSSANLLAVAAACVGPGASLKPGDEVLVPAVSWATTYYPLTQYGLIPRFVDLDLDTLNMDPDLAEEAVGPRTKAILAVNLLGNPNRFDRLQDIATRHSLVLIEDNCESLGATFEGRAAGTFGVMGTYSSFFSHHISTMEGGLIVTDDELLAQKLVSMRAHGWTRQLPDDNLIHPKFADPFVEMFQFVLPGYNVRPLEMSGAIGVQQIRKLPSIVRARRANAAHFVDAFGGHEDIRIQKEVGESSWFGFSMILEGRLKGRRREVVDALSAASIESRPIVTGNFARQPVAEHLNLIVPDELPAADRVHDDGLFVGNHHYDVSQRIDTLLEVIDAIED